MVPILDLLLAHLYPPRCPACRRELRGVDGRSLCRSCIGRLTAPGLACPRCGEPGAGVVCALCRAVPPPFDACRSAFLYEDGELSSELVRRWKYQRELVVGAALAAVLVAHRDRYAECYDVLVPVPVHRSRLRARGFNQAAVLALAVARPGERVAWRGLVRLGEAPSQAALGRRARAGNVGGAFVVRRPARLPGGGLGRAELDGRRVLLVDDVFTTGATARACSLALRSAGAAAVDVLTLARTPRGAAGAVRARPAPVAADLVGA